MCPVKNFFDGPLNPGIEAHLGEGFLLNQKMLLALAALHRALLRLPLIYFLEAPSAESNFKAKAIVRLAIELPSNSDFSSPVLAVTWPMQAASGLCPLARTAVPSTCCLG